ncbi:MAG: hypothetical protein OXN88_03230 [Chloroflexota bacterium]|nr:hypothetical protein [Chloroflexota bacterium]
MPRGLDSRRRNLPCLTHPRLKRGLFSVFLVMFMGPLASCALPAATLPRPEITPSAAPLIIPTATVFLLDSEALYADGQGRSGRTSRHIASLPSGSVLPPAPSGDSERGVSVLLDPHTILPGELYREGGQVEPAILMLGAETAAWGALPLQLSEAGFVVLTLQTASSTPAGQVDAMLQSLIAIPGVDAGAIGLIGEARAADLAMLGCAVNTLCDALALFSPLSRDTLLNMIPSFGERPLWLSASSDDGESHAAALSLSQSVRGRAQFELVDTGRGAAILNANPGLSEQLVKWFALHLRGSE